MLLKLDQFLAVMFLRFIAKTKMDFSITSTIETIVLQCFETECFLR